MPAMWPRVVAALTLQGRAPAGPVCFVRTDKAIEHVMKRDIRRIACQIRHERPKGATIAQAETDGTSDNIARFPGAGPEPQRRSRKRSKDPTNATRQRRHRGKRKSEQTVTPPSGNVPVGDIFCHDRKKENPNEIKATVTLGEIDKRPFHYAPPLAPDTTAQPSHQRHGAAVDVAAYAAAVALAGAAAFFSIRGMVVIFPGSPVPVFGMAVAMEAAKLVTAGWLARRWSETAAVWRAALAAFVFGLAVINAAGVYAQLVAAHVGERGAATSRLEERTAALDARLEVQAHKVADLDRRLGQIDSMIEGATKRAGPTLPSR
jgi:hypothetical protein